MLLINFVGNIVQMLAPRWMWNTFTVGPFSSLKTGILAAVECSRGTSQSPEKEPCVSNISGMTVSSSSLETTIEEETDEQIAAGVAGNLKPPLPVSASKLSDRLALDTKMYTWRIDLSRTEHYWNGWFKGLSQKFLDVPVPKILLLANIHGLDTALTVGQMQGNWLGFFHDFLCC